MVRTGDLTYPVGCTHFTKFDAYQRGIYDEALKYTPNRNCALDIGSHVGIFTLYMEADFNNVIAFEPFKENYAALKHNVEMYAVHKDNIVLVNYALSNKPKNLNIANVCKGNSGATEVVSDNSGQVVTAYPLDMLNLKPDLIKLDIQGHELFALQGGFQTIKQYKPTLIVEMWNEGDTTELCRFIDKDLDYKEVARIKKDGVFIARGRE